MRWRIPKIALPVREPACQGLLPGMPPAWLPPAPPPCLSPSSLPAAVLRLEAEVEAFVTGSEEPQYVFSGDMSSYEVRPRVHAPPVAAAALLASGCVLLSLLCPMLLTSLMARASGSCRAVGGGPSHASAIAASHARTSLMTLLRALRAPCSACLRTAPRSTGAWRPPRSTTGRSRGTSWPCARPRPGRRRSAPQGAGRL